MGKSLLLPLALTVTPFRRVAEDACCSLFRRFAKETRVSKWLQVSAYCAHFASTLAMSFALSSLYKSLYSSDDHNSRLYAMTSTVDSFCATNCPRFYVLAVCFGFDSIRNGDC